MLYAFNTDYAIQYGVEEAIMIHNFQFWLKKNKLNEHNIHNGRAWTYNTRKAYSELFSFWTEKQVRRILNSLVEQGVIITGKYGENNYDQTLWYAFADENAFLELGQVDKSKEALPSAQMGKSYLLTDSKPNSNQPSDDKNKDFEELWKLYPNKDGKSEAFRHLKASVKTDLDLEDVRLAISNYLKSEKVRNGFVKNGSTFFNNWKDWVNPSPSMMGRVAIDSDPNKKGQYQKL